MTWAELIRRLKAAGFVEQRTGKGSHRKLVHPTTGARILKDAGLQ
jgi:predicted RNA binding protein YcfA (HicA-like mRNA interferase family)